MLREQRVPKGTTDRPAHKAPQVQPVHKAMMARQDQQDHKGPRVLMAPE